MIGGILALIGLVIAAIGGLWLYVEGFKESIVWGLLMLFVGPVSLVFVAMHWDKAGKPFLIHIGGIVLMVLGMMLGAESGPVGP
ncbi:MAG: hypothetical protein JKY65_16560 [Planctomycetes bacterium]|nr:hypothetical protein [Planctomycetota bacterium]